MGTIEPYETAAGKRWRVRFRKPDHQQTTRRGFKTRREADLFLASVEVSKARGEFIEVAAARAPIEQLGSEWLTNRTHLKPSTLRPLEIAWRVHVQPRWGRVPVSAVRHSDVQAWVAEMSSRRGPSTVARAYGILASVLDTAVADRRVLANPARGVKLPRRVRRPHAYLTHAQVSDLAIAAGDKRLLVLVLAYCGLRWGEAVALRCRDVDLERRRISINLNAVEVGDRIEVGTPKTHKRRSVPFPGSLVRPLAMAIRDQSPNDLLFTSSDGGYLRRTRTNEASRGWFTRAVKRAGLPAMTPHDLRHTAASLAVSAGANVKAVQRMLGHASASMTLDVYSDLFDDDLNAVADRLDEGLAVTDVVKMWPADDPDKG